MKTLLRFVIGLLFIASTLSIWAQPKAVVQLDSVWGCPGQVVEVPVRVFGIEETGVSHFDFTFRLNTDVLEPLLLFPESGQTFPLITAFNEELQQRGGFVANVVGSEIIVAWIDRTAGRLSPTLEDGSVLFNLNLRIRDTERLLTPESIEIRLVTMGYMDWPTAISYVVEPRSGYVLAKSSPDVRIDRTFMDNPHYNLGILNPHRFSDFTMCTDHSFQFIATGAERFVWHSLSIPGAGGHVMGREHFVLDRLDVHNPVFTPRSMAWFANLSPPIIMAAGPVAYRFVVTGFDSDGCFGTDTVTISVHGVGEESFNRELVAPPDHVVIDRGETLDLEFELLPRYSVHGAIIAHAQRYIVRWFPHDLIETPLSVTVAADTVVRNRTKPINESTWIWAEIRELPQRIEDSTLFARAIYTMHGCVQLINIRVDIRDEMFSARISAMNPENLQEYDYFCGTPGITEQRTMLAALIEGGSGERAYYWSFTPLYSGQAPVITDESANPTEITLFGTTEVSVIVVDLETGQEIMLFDTLFVETPRTLSVDIAMDDASQRFFDMGFCQTPQMPLTLVATVDNQGAYYNIFWEETRANGNTYRILGMQGREVTFPQAREGSVYRAVVESSDRCVTQHTVRSNEIDPQSQAIEHVAVILDEVFNPGCNTTSTELIFRVANVGYHPLFHIYRNDELYMSFDSVVANPHPFHTEFRRQVESKNYWDRFSVRFMNQSARCLRHPYVVSEERTLRAYTTMHVNAGNIVSIFGDANEVCQTPDGVFTFHLENMEQFSRGATVIWRVNGVEWGRYEFDPTLLDAVGRPSNPVILNELMDVDEETAFAQGFPFHINAPGFPQIGTTFHEGSSLSVTVMSRVMCGTMGTIGGTVTAHTATLTPTFIPRQDAILTVVQDKPTVCKGDDITFTASIENMNINAGVMSWFLNGNRVGEGTTFTLNNALNTDEVTVLFESNFACAPNLPLRETRVIEAHEIPTLALIADTLVCVGEDIQLYAETNAKTFLWTGNLLSYSDIQNPVAELSTVLPNTIHDFTVVVTSEHGCQATASVAIRTAPVDEISAHIWLENPADTVVCRGNLVVVRSEMSSIGSANVERVWLRNGIPTHHTDQELTTSAIRDGDVWQMQVSMPTLNTCMPRTALSNPVKFQTAGITIVLDPTRHPNTCATPDGQYLFVALPRCPATTTRFNWIINGLDAGYRLGDVPTFERALNPGDIVQARITSCQGSLVFSNRIEIQPSPQSPIVEGARVICCDQETITLTVENPQENVTFRWYSSTDDFTQAVEGVTNNNIAVGTHRIVATSENNCETVVEIDVVEGTQPKAKITLLTSPADVRTREPIRFRNDGAGWARAYWQFGNGNGEIEHHGTIVEHEFESFQNYVIALRVVSLDGCEATYSLSLDVQPSMVGVFVPTAFMPSSHDERNRYLRVFATDQNPIVSLRLTVFAMDGRELFTTNDPNRGWNGMYNGSEMPTGNYSWMVSARLSSGEEVTRSGVSTLVR